MLFLREPGRLAAGSPILLLHMDLRLAGLADGLGRIAGLADGLRRIAGLADGLRRIAGLADGLAILVKGHHQLQALRSKLQAVCFNIL